MADKKISELTAVSALTGAESVEVVQGGVNKKTTTQEIANLGGGGGAVAAADVSFAPAGTIAATDVQAALEELDSEKQAALGFTPIQASDVVGVQDLPIPAQAMWPRQTSGCSALTQYEMTTSILNLQGLEFSDTVQQFAQFIDPMPRKYNNSTITAVIHWKPAGSGSGDVRWGLQLASYRNDDALTVAFGTEVAVTDTYIAENDLHITTVSGSITPSGTLADGNLLALQVNRDPTNGSDTLDVNAILLCVTLRITTDAAIDG